MEGAAAWALGLGRRPVIALSVGDAPAAPKAGQVSPSPREDELC